MNPSLRRHPTLILILTAVLAWPWSAALAISSTSSSDGAFPSANSAGQAGKPGRHDRSHGGAISPALDDSDDGDGVDSEAMLHLIAANLPCSYASEPIFHPSSATGMAFPPSTRSGAAPFRLLC